MSKIFFTVAALLLIVIAIFALPKFSNQLNVISVVLTLAVLIIYAYDTHRIADQTIESNLRPVILRAGDVEKWENVSNAKPLVFKISKNIAKDIQGEFYLNNKKFQLLFASEVTRLEPNNSKGQGKFRFLEKMGWHEPNTTIIAIYDSQKSETSNEDNGFFIKYQDIEGNCYFTKEGSNFSQSSGKCKN